MYTLEQRMKAVRLFFEYDRSSAAVRRELGYPSRGMLRLWVKEFEITGTLHVAYRPRPPRFTPAQKKAAIDYYLEHGCNLSRTVKALGYPNRETLRFWLDEAIPNRRQPRTAKAGQDKVKLTSQQKEQAVKDLCLRDGTAKAVADQYGVSRETVYKWKNELLGKERSMDKYRRKEHDLGAVKAELENEVKTLEQKRKALEDKVYQLRLERDILEAAAEILKKDQGTDPKRLSNKEKAVMVGALKHKYRLNELLCNLSLAKSSYYYQCAASLTKDKYADLRERVHTVFSKARGCYGYRRVHAVVTRDGKIVSEKVIRRIMREENLVALNCRRRRYNSYKGEISPAVPNPIERNFHADAPNEKWLTDLTEFSLPAGKVYLSPIVDCFDGLAVSWTIGTNPNATLVNSMLDEATSTLSVNERPVLHSDRGSHYRWPGWISRAEQAGVIRSMSKKACTADNAACEGFFGRLKTEMFYGRKWNGVSINRFIDKLDSYLHWYNDSRIKMSLGAMSPMEYRRSLGYA